MKKLNNNSNSEVPKRKERHIVSWSKEEDDVLREQISIHGTENWAIIASNFKDKTTRQCRRRWFTYLNSDFKKGGWSPEEDMLLCEAQKMFGNRWTEIAKVVSGRTDNAVKNRFTTLCKKRAKQKENSTTSYINLNNKRVLFLNERSESTGSLKKLRTYSSNITENLNQKEHLLRPPFAVLAENIHSCEVNKMQGTFLKKDDPKVVALLQQAELLRSLAIKVNSGKTEHSLESAWTVLQDFLKENKENKENKESDQLTSKNPDNDFQFEKFKEIVEDLRSTNEGSKPSWREPDIYESSPDSSEYSTGSTLLSNVSAYKTEDCLSEENRFHHTTSKNEAKEDIEANKEALCEFSNKEFSSPLHVTPFFRSLAATIPSPKFSESEKHFLMKTLGMESNSPSPITNPSQPPPCKRSLLHCL